MPLNAGRRFGPYEILEFLAAGGMGEVYRARDTRLSRDVAVKVLPASFAADPDRLRRFSHEAQAASALNHPNVLIVHDVGQHDGFPYIVSELLEGTTLRTELARGPLRLQRALDCAIQIAHGLAAAHERGIVHRDLKPDNLFLVRGGQLKILDFGLAKATRIEAAELETMVASAPGLLLGTVGYMAPEQVRGERVDQRSDIFSFGTVLHEMLFGRAPFARPSAIETLHAIVNEEPPDPTPTSQLPSAVTRVIKRCLNKDPDQRFQLMQDVAFALEAVAAPAEGGVAAGGAGHGATRRRLAFVPWAIAVIAVAMTGAVLMSDRSNASRETRTVRFEIAPPRGGVFQPVGSLGVSAVIAPDGRTLALVVNTEGRRQLFVRSLDSTVIRALPGTDGAANPFWSPDSRWIGFFADAKMKKVEITGGSPLSICSVLRPASGAWGADDVIVFTAGEQGLFRVSAAAGNQEPVSLASDRSGGAFWPSFLPDGRHFVYLHLTLAPEAERRAKKMSRGELRVRTIEPEATPVTLASSESKAVYAPTGHLLSVREGTLHAQPFDATNLRLMGAAVPVAEGLMYLQPLGAADFSVSNAGMLAYRAAASEARLVWFTREGAEADSIPETGSSGERFRLSPDGKTLAVALYDRRTGTPDLWLFDLARRVSSPFTSEPGMEWMPVWSPDATRIAFSADEDSPPFPHVKKIGETRIEPLVESGNFPQIIWDWTRTAAGEFILYGNTFAETGTDLVVLPLSGDRKPRPFAPTPLDQIDARFSPDGKWVAYVSNDSGRQEIYICAFADPRERQRISTAGGSNPRWTRGGKELVYRGGDGRLMAVSVKDTGSAKLEIGQATPLFALGARDDGYEVSADGTRFLVHRNEGPSSLVNVVLNGLPNPRP